MEQKYIEYSTTMAPCRVKLEQKRHASQNSSTHGESHDHAMIGNSLQIAPVQMHVETSTSAEHCVSS